MGDLAGSCGFIAAGGGPYAWARCRGLIAAGGVPKAGEGNVTVLEPSDATRRHFGDALGASARRGTGGLFYDAGLFRGAGACGYARRPA